MGKHLVRVAVVLAATGAAADVVRAQTTWTGAVSRDWIVAGNWSAGVPDDLDDVTVPAVANLPRISGFGSCRGLVVATGAAVEVVRPNLTTAGILAVHGNATFGGSMTGTGRIEFRGPIGVSNPPAATVTFTGGARATNVVVEPGHLVQFTDLAADTFSVDSPSSFTRTIRIDWNGTTRLGYASTYGTPQGTIFCPVTASLEVDTFDLAWNFQPPTDCAIRVLRAGPTSSVTPTGGTIRIPPTKTMAMTSTANNVTSLAVDVPQGASFSFRDEYAGGSGTNRIQWTAGTGSVAVESADLARVEVPAIAGGLYVSGESVSVVVSATNSSFPPILAGGSLRISMPTTGSSFNPTRVATVGVVQVDGRLQVDARAELVINGASASVPGLLNIGVGGTLRLDGTFDSTRPPVVRGGSLSSLVVDVLGRVEAQHFAFRELGTGGVRLGAGSVVGAAPFDFRNGSFEGRSAATGAVLLHCARTAPTVLRALQFDATVNPPPACIRASTPVAVDVIAASGPLGFSAYESDPHAAIGWVEGISFAAPASPGCRGVAECRCLVRPAVGFGEREIEIVNAPLSAPVLMVFGFDVLASPLPVLGIDFWLSPSAPMFTAFLASSGTGRAAMLLGMPPDPIFAGTSFWAMGLLGDSLSCTPQGVSASTTIRLTFAP